MLFAKSMAGQGISIEGGKGKRRIAGVPLVKKSFPLTKDYLSNTLNRGQG